MNQISAIRPSVVPVSRKKGLAPTIKGAIVALAVAAAFLANLSTVRADGDDDGTVPADGGQVELKLGGKKPTSSDPGLDSPPAPPSAPSDPGLDSPPAPPSAPSDPGPDSPPDPPSNPGPTDGDGPREITESRDGTDEMTPGDDTPEMPVEYVVMIRIAKWGVHSRNWEDQDLAEAYAEGLKYHPEYQVRLDSNTGRYALLIRVREFTKYAAFPTQEEADAYAQQLRDRHPGGRLEVKVAESKD